MCLKSPKIYEVCVCVGLTDAIQGKKKFQNPKFEQTQCEILLSIYDKGLKEGCNC